MKVALVSSFLEDDVYEKRLTDKFMEEVICKEDHFYHRIAKALMDNNIEPVVHYLSQEKSIKKFTHKYGHDLVRVPATKISFIHEPIIYSSDLVKLIKTDYEICNFVSGYYVMYKIPDMFDYSVFKLNKKIPLIARWAGGNYDWLFPIRKYIKKSSLQKCDRIISSSKKEIKNLEERFDIPKEKIVHLINPLDTSLFKRRKKDDVAEKINLDLSFRYLLYVGRLTKNKGIELLLDVFLEISKEIKDMKLIIIGDGPLSDYINSFITKNSIKEKIILTGRLTHNRTCFYYNIASALINVGMSGGLANVIMEGIASQIPVISTNVGASDEVISNENGILINPNDKLGLKEAIKKILQNEKQFKKFDVEFVKKSSFEHFGKKLASIYQNVIEEKNK